MLQEKHRPRSRQSPIWTANAILLCALVAFSAEACLWDSDTLATEAKGLPGLAEIITGRFERNPKLFYKMRIERVAREIDAQPSKLALYDDAAVACDRLHESDAAIEWMTRKRVQLDSINRESAEYSDHQYRYLANLGTFHAHRWLRSGANRDDLDDMHRARDLISKAIEINPDAHFGRERYQLLAIDWVLRPPQAPSASKLPTIFHVGVEPRANIKSLGYDDAAEGLAGLIVLGDASNSIDIFNSLGAALSNSGHASLAYLTKLRCVELARDGRTSLHPEFAGRDDLSLMFELMGHQSTTTEAIDAYFIKAREAADRWHQDRMIYMLAQLESGRHPDTHPDFWDDYEADDPPALPNGLLGLAGERLTIVRAGAGIAAVVFGCYACSVIVRRIRRHALPN